MWNAIEAAIDSLFIGPVWPASVLVLLVVGYLVLSLLGAVEFEGPELSPDLDGWQGLGAGTLRWFHLGSIPVILWLGCFAIINWLIAYGLWNWYESDGQVPSFSTSAILALRNAILASFVTKLVTGPLVPYLESGPTFSEETLIGESCVVSSGEVTPEFGQAKFFTGSAPLLLNVRTSDSRLVKGDRAIITAYDPNKRIFTVTSEPTSNAILPQETAS